MPLPGGVRLLVEIVETVAVPQPPLDVEHRVVVVDGQGVGGIGLQLDRVGAGRLRRLDQRQGAAEIAVVVAGDLGDDVRRMAGSDRPAGNGDGAIGHCRCSLAAAAIGETDASPFRTSPSGSAPLADASEDRLTNQPLSRV